MTGNEKPSGGLGARSGPLARHDNLDSSCASAVLLRARRRRVRDVREHRDRTLGADYPTVADFYRGRRVFLTGATGFVGKVVLEKLLRSCEDIDTVYVLTRPRRGLNADERLAALLNTPVFGELRRRRPAVFQKVVAVEGDCAEPGLGLSVSDRQTLVDTVSVVIHSAASVRLTDPVSRAVLLNTRSASTIVDLARQMASLKVLVHVSTAFCATNHQPSMECVYPTPYAWEDAIKYANLPDSDVLDVLGPKFLCGQPNSYLFSKALAERVMEDASRDLPVVIVRPSIVVGALEEPLPGWMDSLHGFGMFWVSFSKGLTRVSQARRGRETEFDLVPVDTVSKATIAASWARGTGQPLLASSSVGGPAVFNVALGDVRPTRFGTMADSVGRGLRCRSVVYPGAIRYPRILMTRSRRLAGLVRLFEEIIFGVVVDLLLGAFGINFRILPVYRRVHLAMSTIQQFIDGEFKFDSSNLWDLLALLHPADRKDFDFRIESFSFEKDEVARDQLLGVLSYALKESSDAKTIRRAASHVQRLWWGEMCCYLILAAVFVTMLSYFGALSTLSLEVSLSRQSHDIAIKTS